MANSLKTLFSEIGTAIREKVEVDGTMKPVQFPEKIRTIAAGSGEVEIVDGVDPYYQQLAEAVIMRQAKYLSGDETTMSMKGFKTSDGSTLGTLAPYSFAGFENVEGMAFTDVVMIGTNSFAGNAKLKILDFTVTEAFATIGLYDGALNGCDALEAIIIRAGAGGLTGAPVNSANGSNAAFYVYVPAAYYDAVVAKLGTNALPADRYRRLEDYPEVDNWNKTYTVNFYDGSALVDTQVVKYGETAVSTYKKDGYQLVSWTPSNANITQDTDCYGEWVQTFAAASWEDVMAAAENGTAAEMWAVGDKKDLTLSYSDGTSETVSVKIAGFNVGLAEDGNPFAIAFALPEPLKDLWPLSTVVYTTFDSTKYNAMAMMTHLDNDVFPAMPSILQNKIKAKQNYHSYIPARKLWLYSEYEVDKPMFADSKLVPLYNIFPDAASRMLCPRGTTSPVEWWLGTMSSYSSVYYGAAYDATGQRISDDIGANLNTGRVNERAANGERGVVFGFGI